MTKLVVMLLIALSAWVSGFSTARAQANPDCAAQLQDAMIVARAASPPQMDDTALYVKFYQCLGFSAPQSTALAKLRLQLASAAQAYLNVKIRPADYRAFILDRQRKAERMRSSPGYAEAVTAGDSDGDLVPDAMDRCPNTAPNAATDANGCDVQCPAHPTPSANVDPVCLAGAAPYIAEDPLRPLTATVPVNFACEDVAPAASAPIAWGERSISRVNGLPFPREIVDSVRGYYFSVRRTSPQAAGCEVWYAVQFVFHYPSSSALPPTDIVSVLFSSKEDETPHDAVARFPMLTHHSRIEGDLQVTSVDLPLSPGRTRLRDDLAKYSQVAIRIRIVTGAQQTSPWSSYIAKAKGSEIHEQHPL